jgi:membrane protein YqaA with SNARE-associated domain
MLRRLYDWCINAAEKPYAVWLMGAVSFAESSFFPVPPDVMTIPMSFARPDRAFYYAAICTVTSVAGGVVGWLIGAFLYDTFGHWVIQLYGHGDKIETFRDAYRDYGAWIILGKGVTPIPYKIVTITAGFAGYSLPLFVLFSVISRGARFFIAAFLIYKFGPQARAIIEKRLGFWVTVSALTLIAGFVVVTYLI